MQRKIVKFPENPNIWIDIETMAVINNYTTGKNETKVQRVYTINFDGHKTRISNGGEQYALHRLIAFTFSNKIKEGWDSFYRYDVHHVDCNRFNNHASNLVVLDPMKHRDYHHIGKSIKTDIFLAKMSRRNTIALRGEWVEIDDAICEKMYA